MEIRCVKGMHRLKLISSENNSGFKGLTGADPENEGGGRGAEGGRGGGGQRWQCTYTAQHSIGESGGMLLQENFEV